MLNHKTPPQGYKVIESHYFRHPVEKARQQELTKIANDFFFDKKMFNITDMDEMKVITDHLIYLKSYYEG